MGVSVIIPTYKRPQLLINCVKTLISQSFVGKYEIIVVDNYCIDNTYEEYLKAFVNNPKVHYIQEPRQGLVYARHAGFFAAKYDILIFADDDAEYESKCIEEICKVYTLDTNVQAVGGKIEIKWDRTPPHWIHQYEPLLGKLNYGTETVISDKLFINGGLFSIRKDTLKNLGGFNPDQVGEHLVGDGETGLCKKMHQQKMLIGWTPHAVMHHLQFVAKNGTVEDIGRRYYNNGVGEGFHSYVTSNYKPNFSVYLRYLTALALFPVASVVAICSRKFFFYKCYFKGVLAFHELWKNPKYREQVLRRDWF